MNLKNYFALALLTVFTFTVNAQDMTPNVPGGVSETGTFFLHHVAPSIESRGDAPEMDLTPQEAGDRRSMRNKVVIGKDRQAQDDYFVRNRNEMAQSVRVMPPSVVFDAYQSGSQPTDPSTAIGLNHVFVVFNTGFAIFDKSGNDVGGGQRPVTDIFSSGGCCDLTASYDQAAERWVLSYLWASNGQIEVAVSDGPDPTTASWNVYVIPGVQDYNKLSIWSDGYYVTSNGAGNKVWALDRDKMTNGDPSASFQTFVLPGMVTSGFQSPQALNISDDNLPATGGATVIYMQDDAWSGVTSDHVKLWTIDVDWTTPSNSGVSAATELPATPFISVFDGGSFSNLPQPSGGSLVDALQATIMNQAQFRKFGTHNSALFNFVVDTDATGGKLAGIRWFELRQSGDNQPWSVYQEGTYTSPDGKHAWHASLIMDGAGNIGMGYTSMSGPTTPDTVRISSYYTGRFAGDPLNTMTVSEELISAGSANIPSTRYGDYSKIDIDPSDDSTFWFINEYFNGGRKGVVGAFMLEPNTTVDDIGATSIISPSDGVLTANEDITINVKNFGINDIANPELQYTINGGTAVVENLGATLVAGTTVPFTFSVQADLSVEGDYTITASTNFASDSNTDNDEVTKVVNSGVIICTPTGDCSFGDGFTLVSIEEIDNTSGCEGYADFTDQAATLVPGSTYELTVTTGYGDQNVRVWIDFNDDGTFSNDETVVPNFVIAPGQAAGTHTETVDLTIPGSVPTGSQHRMRVKSNWQAPVPDDACEETQYGETEDYSANMGVLGTVDQDIVAADLMVLTLANNQFDISLTTEFDGVASIAISNILGQTLAFNNLEKEGNSYNYKLDMSYADAGVYFIKMGDRNSKTYKTAKIIVK